MTSVLKAINENIQLKAPPTLEEIQARNEKREEFKRNLASNVARLAPWEDFLTKNKLSLTQYQAAKKLNTDAEQWITNNISEEVLTTEERRIQYIDSFTNVYSQMVEASVKEIRALPDAEAAKLAPQFPEAADIPKLQAATEEARAQHLEEERKKQAELEGRTWWDDFRDASKSVLQTLLILFFIGLAIRAASFKANDYLYKPYLYRIFIFIYALIFFPFSILQGFYREVRHYIWPECPRPLFHSMLPLYGYDPEGPITFKDRFFGFPLTTSLQEWILKQQKEEEEGRNKVLEGTAKMLEALASERSSPATKA